MPVALKHLGGDICTLNSQFSAHVVLDEGRDVGEIAHSSAHLTCLDVCRSSLETANVAFHLLVPQGPLETEAGDVGVDAVGAADTGSGLELQGACAEHFHEVLHILEEDCVGLLEKVTVGGVHYIGGGEAVVHPFALLSEALAHGTGESHHVVAGLLFDFANAGNLEAGVRADLFNVRRRNDSQFAPCFA